MALDNDFEVEISADYLAKIEQELKSSVDALRDEGAFVNYNRGGGPAGSYDRHYDKSTRR